MKNERHKKTPETDEKKRDFFTSPLANVGAMALIILAVLFGLRLLAFKQSQAQLRFVEQLNRTVENTSSNANAVAPAPEIFNGEAYETTVRLRETGALALAMSLAVSASGNERRALPANVDAVFSDVAAKGLMPPGVFFENGRLRSEWNSFSVRYRPQPMGFEVVGRPIGSRAGSAILLRFPAISADGRTISYFLANAAESFENPPPFSSPENLKTAGWTLRQWRGELMPNGRDLIAELREEQRLLQGLSGSR